MFFSKRQKGQGLVEFALILPILLLVVLGLIETALLFQAYLAIQHGAREAARFAVSMQPPIGHIVADDGSIVKCPGDGELDKWGIECSLGEDVEGWQKRRVEMIKHRALEASLGVRVNRDNLSLGVDEFESDFLPKESSAGFFGVRVWGFHSLDEAEEDHPSLPGLPVRVVVYHRAEILDPLFQAIIKSVRLTGRAEMINEGIQVGYGNRPPPTLPPEPPIPDPTPPGDNSPPDKPVNQIPEAEATVETSNPQFTWSTYHDPDGDSQSHLQVQLRLGKGSYGGDGSRDSDEVESSAGLYTPADWDLASGEYCWQVRVRDERGLWSDYSDETCFTVDLGDLVPNDPPYPPVNASPVESGGCVVLYTAHPQFTWSVYFDPNGDPQSHLQVQLRTSGGGYGGSGSLDSGEVASDASAHTPPWYLDDGEYYWRVRVRDDRGMWSEYSDETCFIVEAAPYLAVVGDRQEGEPFVLGESVTIFIGKHNASTIYDLWWVDPDGTANRFADDAITTDANGYGGYPWALIDPPGWELIPDGIAGQTYTCTVQSRDSSGNIVATQHIPVLVPLDLPDLVVTGISLLDSPQANVPTKVTVDIQNTTYSTVEGFFDINVYVDPDRLPTQGRPGTSLQWINGIGPLETKSATFVITLIGMNDHEVWAYVDATDAVDEGNEDNNRFGPVSTFAGCGGYP
jgi:hypothetical protein